MNQKLTLSIEQDAVVRGKRYAERNGVSLSSVVKEFLLFLGEEEEILLDVPISSKLKSLAGIGAGDFDESDYRKHVEARYAEVR